MRLVPVVISKIVKKMTKKSKVNQKGTIAIFEEEVLLPKKEKKPPRKATTDDIEEFSTGNDDWED